MGIVEDMHVADAARTQLQKGTSLRSMVLLATPILAFGLVGLFAVGSVLHGASGRWSQSAKSRREYLALATAPPCESEEESTHLLCTSDDELTELHTSG